MLSPMRLKKGCSATFTTTYRSPAGPPKRPASPLPGTRIRDPVLTPAGNVTSKLSVPAWRPPPPQTPQGLMNLPDPLQSAQVTANWRCPFERVVFPVPAQLEHAVSRDPGAWPPPPHIPQP